MKRLLPLLLLVLLPLLGAAQSPSVTVPDQILFAGLRLRLSPAGRAAVQQKVDALRRYPASFNARVALADACFPIIDRVFQEEGIPADFRYLTLQESGLQGDAQSIHDAVGYWQFKRESAQDFGLLVTEQVDERKHLVSATHGAAKYLQRSYGMYHNWLNALLSYNLGPGGVKPYTLPTDPTATEMEITERTHVYVLTFLAHKLAYEPAVGLNPRPAMMLREYPAVPGQPLATLAAALQTNPNELAKHNRWLLAATVPTDKVYTALIPVTDSLQLIAMAVQQRQNATKLITQPETDAHDAAFVTVNSLRAVVALPGETKEALARRAGIKLRRFMQHNDLKPFDQPVAGQPYFLEKKRDKAEVEYHVAQPGESLVAVSQKYGIRAHAIRSKNRMAGNEPLTPGRLLWLQHTRPRDVAVEFVPETDSRFAAGLERPVGTPAPVAAAKPVAPATAAKPAAPATPQPKPAPAPRPVATAATPPPAADAAEAADSTVDNINEVAAEADSTASVAATPATKGVYVYGGRPVKGTVAPPPAQTEPAAAPVPKPVAERQSAPASSGNESWSDAGSPNAWPAGTAPTAKPAPSAPVAAKPASPAAKPAPPVAAPVPTPAPAAAPAPVASTPRPAAPAAAPATSTAPAAAASAPQPIPADGLHTVEKGETLYAVARRYGLRPADIVAWNELPAQPSLQIGQVLRVKAPVAAAPAATTAAKPAATSAAVYTPRSATAAPATPPAPTAKPAPAPSGAAVKHTVAAGESMYAISRKYEVTIKEIMEWNNKPDFNVSVGEVLVVKPGK